MDPAISGIGCSSRQGESQGATPLLSIGLPVFNGAEHLREALDSLLSQDVGDLELIICDNASTDATPEICREYVGRDSRVRYHRNDTNIGLARNYNRTFELARGRFFMWGSDDDVWDSRFARLCIQHLEQVPEAVLCSSEVDFIAHDGSPVADRSFEPLDMRGMSVRERMHDVTRQAAAFSIFAVIRSEVLRGTGLFQPMVGPDSRLLFELALAGEFLCVPERLFSYRVRPAEFSGDLHAERMEKPDEAPAPRWTNGAREFLRVVSDAGLPPDVARQIAEDFIDTLVFENSDWLVGILREAGQLGDNLMPPVAARRGLIRESLQLPTTPSPPFDSRAWHTQPGMRARLLRSAALRLLLPFTERQERLNGMILDYAEKVARLEYEVEWLRLNERRLERLRREGWRTPA